MSKRDFSEGFKRILHDAMVLSASLRAIRECSYYPRGKAIEIDAAIEAHQANALLQIRSMVDFLTCCGRIQHDTMTAVQFAGCTKQTMNVAERSQSNKFAAHKSWDAVAKDATKGAKQLTKRDIVALGLQVLNGFNKFSIECTVPLRSTDPYMNRYREIYNENFKALKRLDP